MYSVHLQTRISEYYIGQNFMFHARYNRSSIFQNVNIYVYTVRGINNLFVSEKHLFLKFS